MISFVKLDSLIIKSCIYEVMCIRTFQKIGEIIVTQDLNVIR